MDIFISHSSKDGKFVDALQTLLRLGLRGLDPEKIRVSSIEQMQFDPGDPIDDTIRAEIQKSSVLIAVISRSALDSHYVSFELGARWGAGQSVFPLLVPGLKEASITGPLKNLNIYESKAGALYKLITATAHALENVEAVPEGFLKDQIHEVMTAKAGLEPLRYAVLSYVVDRDLNFALLKDDFYKKIQPPGRKLERYDRPHDVARAIVIDELSLNAGEVRDIPPFTERSYQGEAPDERTDIVRPPYQVQLERNMHRTAKMHYDFVYLFGINRQKPPLAFYEERRHKDAAAWYSLQDVRDRLGREFGPHPDMVPTMQKIVDELDGTKYFS